MMWCEGPEMFQMHYTLTLHLVYSRRTTKSLEGHARRSEFAELLIRGLKNFERSGGEIILTAGTRYGRSLFDECSRSLKDDM